MDKRLSFGQHINISSLQATECMGNLSRMMPNIGGPREKKRRLVATVVQSKQRYAVPVWALALKFHSISDRLLALQRDPTRRIVLAYRTVSTCAVLVLAGLPPINLLAIERKEIFHLNNDIECTS
ncbi:uncharacterized protein LOC127284066 [Leptopilina boulardi]|uniref:uncharacterized protein LOC127284066 n=1 Tax=Leptopilina boulardi TaxID=63433 RepID=UPI0021F507C8|nr:uncharacterized protein LOC127284066 [Leptopilina boulardi]